MRAVRFILLMLFMAILPMTGFAMPALGQDSCCAEPAPTPCHQTDTQEKLPPGMHCCQGATLAPSVSPLAGTAIRSARVWNPNREVVPITHITPPPEHPPRTA